MLVGLSGRDDADDFFAMLRLPICVDNQQHGSGIGFQPNRSERMPALFSRFAVDAVRWLPRFFDSSHS
jgi:hypothetical protein